MSEEFASHYERSISSLDAAAEEALELRFGFTPPTFDADPAVLLAALQHCRQRLDRLEELLAISLRIKAAADRDRSLHTARADDAWDLAIHDARSSRRNTAVLNTRDEFSSAKEREAEANLTTLDLRRAARVCTDLAGQAGAHCELLRLLHRGLDSARHDLLTALRTLAFESTLDR